MSARKKGQQKTKAEPPPVAKKARIYDYFAPKADAESAKATLEGDCKPAAVASANGGRSASMPSQQESGASSRSSSRGPSPAPTTSAPPSPSPLPPWGALIKPRIAQSWSFTKQHSRQTFLPMLAFTVTFKTVLQDSYFRAPGMGHASNGFWGGIRSALTAHTSGSWDGAGVGKGLPDGVESQEAVDGKGAEGGEGPPSTTEAEGESEQRDTTAETITDDAGTDKVEDRGSQHSRNFGLIARWVLGAGLLVDEDVASLRQLLGLSVTSQGLFWKVYHSLRGCYRLDAQTLGAKPELREAVEELVSAGLLVDMADRVQQNDCGEWIADLDDLLSALHADEVKQVAIGMLGKAAIKGGTRDECVSSIEAALYYTQTGPPTGPQQAQNGTRVRLRLLTTALRGLLSSRFRARANGSRVVAVDRHTRKLVHRAMALFFLSSGYEAEDAVVLLRSDMTRRVFPSIPAPHAPSDPSSPVKDKHGSKGLHYHIDRMYLGLMDHLLALSDAVDLAATVGDADLAYGCLHSASNLLLQRPCPSPAPSPSFYLHLHHHSLLTLFPPTGPGSPPLESHLPPSFTCLTDLPVPLAHLLTRCVWKGIHLLQRECKYDESRHYLNMLLDATKHLPSSVRGRYWTRLLMSLEHQKCFGEALRVCDEALEDTFVDAEDRLYLQNKHAPLCKKAKRWTTRQFPPVRVADVLVLELSLRRDGPSEGKGVEDRTLDFLLGEEEGWKGLHCENGAFLTLFGLLFWDVLFHPLPGVFTTPYQSAPHDLHNRHFLERRKELAERVLGRLARGDACVMLEKAYRDHWGKSCIAVDWTTWALDDMKVIAQALGGSAVESICRTLARDYALWRHGLPDLLLWKAPQHYGGEAYVRCVEVKGPGDDLSWAQRAWLDRLLAAGVCVQVARVRDTDVASGGGRRRRSRGAEEAELDLGICEDDLGD